MLLVWSDLSFMQFPVWNRDSRGETSSRCFSRRQHGFRRCTSRNCIPTIGSGRNVRLPSGGRLPDPCTFFASPVILTCTIYSPYRIHFLFLTFFGDRNALMMGRLRKPTSFSHQRLWGLICVMPRVSWKHFPKGEGQTHVSALKWKDP